MTSFTIAQAGSGYEVGDQLTATLPGADIVTPGTGEILSIFAAGTGGDSLDAADGSLSAVTTSTDGSGTNATVDIEIVSGAVSSFTLVNGGENYTTSDTLTVAIAELGSTTGNDLVIQITSVDADTTEAGPAVTVTADVDSIN